MSSKLFSVYPEFSAKSSFFLKKIGMVHLLKETLKEKKESGI
jgi:hypothetical protein